LRRNAHSDSRRSRIVTRIHRLPHFLCWVTSRSALPTDATPSRRHHKRVFPPLVRNREANAGNDSLRPRGLPPRRRRFLGTQRSNRGSFGRDRKNTFGPFDRSRRRLWALLSQPCQPRGWLTTKAGCVPSDRKTFQERCKSLAHPHLSFGTPRESPFDGTTALSPCLGGGLTACRPKSLRQEELMAISQERGIVTKNVREKEVVVRGTVVSKNCQRRGSSPRLRGAAYDVGF
jgi:hypothetical protein